MKRFWRGTSLLYRSTPERRSKWVSTFVLAVAVLWLAISYPFPRSSKAQAQDQGMLALARHLEVGIAGNGIHLYHIPLHAGTNLMLELGQQEQDLTLMISPPKGEPLKVDGFTSATGIERLFLVAEQTGDHLLKIEVIAGKSSSYKLFATTAPATVADRARATSLSMGTSAIQESQAERRLEGLLRAGRAARQAGDKVLEAEWLARRTWLVGWGERKDEEQRVLLWAARQFEEANLLAQAAVVLDDLGRRLEGTNKELSRACFQRALTLAQQCGSPSLHAQIAQQFGLRLNRWGEVQQAIVCEDQAVSQLGDDWPELKAMLLGEMAVAYSMFGRSEHARALLEQALVIVPPNRPKIWCRLKIQLGWSWYLEGRYERAIALYEEVDRRKACLDPCAISGLNDRIATALRGLRRFDAARKRYDQAYAACPDPKSRAHVLDNIADLELQCGQPDRALKLALSAMAVFQKLDQPLFMAHTEMLAARAEAMRGREAASLTHMEAAAALLQRVRAHVQTRSQIFSMAESHFDILQQYTDRLVQWSIKQGDVRFAERAFEELAWARGFSDAEHLIRAWSWQPGAATDPAILVALEQRIGAMGEAVAQTPQLLERAEWLKESLNSGTERSQPPLTDVQAVQDTLLGEDDLLLCYALGSPRSYVYLISRQTFEVVELDAEEDLRFAVDNYLQQLTRLRQSGSAEARHWGMQASQRLLGKFGGKLTGKRLLLVKDGVLHNLPFAALPDPDEPARLLIDEHEFVVLPSVTQALVSIELQRSLASEATALAVVDPVYDLGDPRRKGLAGLREKGPFERLPGTAREAEVLGELLPGTTVFSAFDASKQRVLSEDLRTYGLIHFGAHGELHEQHPSLSKLMLSRFDDSGAAVDGALYAREVAALHLKAQLVVLSGCRTALGRSYRGQGVWSLGRDFMSAGALRVLVSLWDVDDHATAELMTVFYRELLAEERTPSAALREAQLALRGQPALRSPYYWAAFELQGCPTPMKLATGAKKRSPKK